MDWFLESTSIGRGILFDKAGKTVAKQTKGKYPAPLAILECAKAGMEAGHGKGSQVERQQFGKVRLAAGRRPSNPPQQAMRRTHRSKPCDPLGLTSFLV